MKKNEVGKFIFYPPKKLNKCVILFIGEDCEFTEIINNEYDFFDNPNNIILKFLNKLNIKIEDCEYTTAVDYTLNKKKEIYTQSKEQNYQRLLQQIENSSASIIVPLGSFAAKFILNTNSPFTKKMYGNIIKKDNYVIIPIHNPYSIYHSHDDLKVFTQVFSSIYKCYLNNTIDPGETKYIVLDNEADLINFIDILSNRKYISCDIETSSLITFRAKIWVIGFAVAKNEVYVIPRELFLRCKYFINQIFKMNIKFIWHNGKYDSSVLFYNGVENVPINEDTILLHYCINETPGTHTLGQLATIYLGADEYKSQMNSEFANITTEENYEVFKERLFERVAIDCDYTLQVFSILHPIVESDPGLKELYEELLIPATEFLKRVEINGIKINKKYLKDRVPIYEEKINNLTNQIQDKVKYFFNIEDYNKTVKGKGITKFNPNSVPQLKYLIWNVLKLKPGIRCTPGCTSKDVLLSIKNPPLFLKLILELRTIKKEYSAFCLSYLKLADEKDFIHTSFSLHSAVTGRLSSKDPNIQQIPSRKKDIRRAFIPRSEDRILMEVDYSSAELRVLAWISNDKNLIESVVNGDLHSEVAAKIFGPTFTKEQRGLAKTVNFGIAYGRGAMDLSNTFNYPLAECQRWIDSWAEKYPDAWNYLENCAKEIKRGLELETPYHRRRRMGLISNQHFKELSNEAKNFRIQSISSDNTLIAAMKIEPLIKPFNALIVNLIHDSILIDCPNDPKIIKEVAKISTEIMISIPKIYLNCNVKFKCDVDLGNTWGDVEEYNWSD